MATPYIPTVDYKNMLIRNNPYDDVRLMIVASQSSYNYAYFTQATGDRYYTSVVSSTASQAMDFASFHSYLGFTMSQYTIYEFEMIPMNVGETCVIETNCSCLNAIGTKGYTCKIYGGFRHTGTSLVEIGGQLNYEVLTDFTTVSASFSAFGTQSVRMVLTGEVAQTLDWDIDISYTKGFHNLTSRGGTLPDPAPIIYVNNGKYNI